MTKNYTLEFAVETHTEFQAMKRLKSLGLSKAEDAKLSDLDHQAGLFIIRVASTDEELTDVVYKKIIDDKDIYILSDELAEYRSRQMLKIISPVERQLKKLLICVLPETEKVFADIMDSHQKHKTNLNPTTRIEWCQRIDDFSLGEMLQVLEIDISKITTKNLLTSEGILSLIATSDDFDTLKKDVAEIIKPKTVWTSIAAILEKPAELSYIAKELKELSVARNDAAHLRTITQQRLNDAKNNQKHVMDYIGKTKSDYQTQLKADMEKISKSMRSIVESAVKIDPPIIKEMNKALESAYKPIMKSISKIQAEITAPLTADIIKNGTKFSEELNKGLMASMSQMQPTPEYKEILNKINTSGIQGALKAMHKDADQLKNSLNKPEYDSTKERGDE